MLLYLGDLHYRFVVLLSLFVRSSPDIFSEIKAQFSPFQVLLQLFIVSATVNLIAPFSARQLEKSAILQPSR